MVRSQVFHVKFALFNSLFDWTCLFGAICQISLVCSMTASYLNCLLSCLVPQSSSLLSFFRFLFVGMFCFWNQNSIGMSGWDHGREDRWRINIFSPYPAEVDSHKKNDVVFKPWNDTVYCVLLRFLLLSFIGYKNKLNELVYFSCICQTRIQSNFHYRDLDYLDFSIIQTFFSGPSFHEY